MTMPTGELDQAVAQAEVGMTEAPAAVEGRSLWQTAWRRIRRSKVALISLAFIVFLILLAIFAPLIAGIEGQDPYTFHNSNTVLDDGSISFTPGLPLPGYMYPSATHWLGVEPQTGRDIFARFAYGARVSLTIAILRHPGVGRLRHGARCDGRLLRRVPRLADQPGHGPAAGLPDLALLVDVDPDPPEPPVQHVPGPGQHVAHRVAGRDPGLLRLALPRPNSPRPGAQPARAGVRRVGAGHRVVDSGASS